MTGTIAPLGERFFGRVVTRGDVFGDRRAGTITVVLDVCRPTGAIGERVAEIIVLRHIDAVMLCCRSKGAGDFECREPVGFAMVIDQR